MSKARQTFRIVAATFGLAWLQGCMSLPEGVVPIQDFDVEAYAGTWYEIARLDHRFERGLQSVTARYRLLPNGKVEVWNQGWNEKKARWKSAKGDAKLAKEPNVGHLGVSFFGPFRFSYVLFDWNREKGTAFVSGPNHDTLWLLSRTPVVDEASKKTFVDLAQAKGFDLSSLIWVDQTVPPVPSPQSTSP